MMLRCLTVSLVCGSIAAQATPPPSRVLADVLPTSTYAVAQFGGMAACTADAKALPLAALVRGFLGRVPDELRAERIDGRLDFAADHIQRVLQRVGVGAADLRTVLRQPMQLAVGRLTIEGMGPSLCLCVDEHGAEAAIGRVVAALRGAVRQRLQSGEQGAIETVDIDGVALEQLTTNGPPIFFGSLAGCLVVSNSRGYLHEIAAVARGAAPSLGGSMTAARADDAGAEALASLFVDGRRVVASFEPHLPYEASLWSDALGIGALQTVHATVRAGADTIRLGIGGSASGLAKVLLAAPAELGFARACSANTVAFGAGSVDLLGLTAAWQKFLALLPAVPRRELQGELGRGLRRAGSKPGEVAALAHAFAPQVAFALALEKGALPKPELLLRIGVRDAAAVQAVMQGLEAETTREGVEWRTRQAD